MNNNFLGIYRTSILKIPKGTYNLSDCCEKCQEQFIPPLKYILQLGCNTETVQQATRRDTKYINPGNYMDTWGKKNEITRARIWSRYKDATVGKCLLINNCLRVILFSISNLKMQGKTREENYNCKCQQLLEQKWEESALHWVMVTIHIYCVI